MKKIIFLAMVSLSLVFASCGNKQSDSNKTDSSESAVNVDKAMCVEDILTNADKYVNKEIVLKGFVTHTCSHSGRRCFILGKDEQTSIRVEAKGNIGGFNRELNGSQVAIKGILRESHLTKEYINQMEEELSEKEGSKEGESCDSEMKNIQSMRKWMKDNNRDTYSVYYLDGTDYEVIE